MRHLPNPFAGNEVIRHKFGEIRSVKICTKWRRNLGICTFLPLKKENKEMNIKGKRANLKRFQVMYMLHKGSRHGSHYCLSHSCGSLRRRRKMMTIHYVGVLSSKKGRPSHSQRVPCVIMDLAYNLPLSNWKKVHHIIKSTSQMLHSSHPHCLLKRWALLLKFKMVGGHWFFFKAKWFEIMKGTSFQLFFTQGSFRF